MKKSKAFWEGIADAFSFIMLWVVVLMLFTLMLAGCTTVPDVPYRVRSDIVAELNRYRMERGMQAVTTNPRLQEMANERARHAWPYRNGRLADGHAGFQRAIDSHKAPGKWFGENLYAGPFSPTSREAITAWHLSPPHQKMMNRPTSDDCSATEAYDGQKSVVALICADRTKEDLL